MKSHTYSHIIELIKFTDDGTGATVSRYKYFRRSSLLKPSGLIFCGRTETGGMATPFLSEKSLF